MFPWRIESIKRTAFVLRMQNIFVSLLRYRESLRQRVIALDGRAARWAIWLAVALFLVGFTYCATESGRRVRDEAWIYSRSIRFDGDVATGFQWGNEVVQSARQEMQPPSDPTHNSPSFWQVVRAENRTYDRLVNASDGDYGLDYPPIRLLTMALWARHVQQTLPYLSYWPGRWRPGVAVTEDIAAPLLDLNTLFTWLSCIFAFFLVWLWVNRGGRRGTSKRVSLLGPRRPPLRQPTPLVECAGLLLFPPLACLFYYALLVAVAPCPAPPPMVSFSGPPVLSRTAQGVSAEIRATINPQGAATRWAVDWGLAPDDYSHIVLGNNLGNAQPSTDVSVTLSNLPPDSIVHYRITARNDASKRDLGRGITRTDDVILLTGLENAQQPFPPSQPFNAVWLSLWQWLGIAALFAALSGSIRWMPAEHRGWACGLLAAMLIWLNPAVLVVSHVWPQWDTWLLPPFLLAALLASVEWWFWAGIAFGLGTMFKGQFFICAPVLMLWPLLSMRWGAFFRLILGAILCTGLMVSPWLILANQPFSWSLPAVNWITRIAIAAAIASLLPLLRRPLRACFKLFQSRTVSAQSCDPPQNAMTPPPPQSGVKHYLGRAIRSLWAPESRIPLAGLIFLAAIIAAALMAMVVLILARWPSDAQLPRSMGLWLFLAMLIPPCFIPRRRLDTVVAGITGVAIWMSAWLYHGDWAWETVGFEYGMSKHDQVAGGRGSMGNLASILEQHFGFGLHDPAISLHLPNLSGFLPTTWLACLGLDGHPLLLDFRQMLIAVFAALIVACAAGAALNDRRNHPHFLAAMVAPWMLMPNVLGQMMTRYQMYGAVLAALLIGISRGFVWVCVLYSLVGAGMIGNQLLSFSPGRSPQLHQIFTALAPDDGWIMLCLAALVFVVALIPGQVSDDQLKLPLIDARGEAPVEDSALLPVQESVAEQVL